MTTNGDNPYVPDFTQANPYAGVTAEYAAQVAAAGDTALEFFGGLLTPGAGNSKGTGVS